MKEPIFLAIILFRLCNGENSLDDDEHENEDDDFSTSEFRIMDSSAASSYSKMIARVSLCPSAAPATGFWRAAVPRSRGRP